MNLAIKSEAQCKDCRNILRNISPTETDKQIIINYGCFHLSPPTSETDIADIINKVGYYAPKLTPEVCANYSKAAKDYLKKVVVKHKIKTLTPLKHYFVWLDNNIEKEIEHIKQYNEWYNRTQVYDEKGISIEHYNILKECDISKEQLFADGSRDALIIQDLFSRDKLFFELQAAFSNANADNYISSLLSTVEAIKNDKYKTAYLTLVKHVLSCDRFTHYIQLGDHNESTYRKKLIFTQTILNAISVPLTTEKKKKKNEKLADIITHDKSKEIADFIKTQFRNIKGKQLKLLFVALQQLGLLPTERTAQRFHLACANSFDWDIASYHAMNNYHYNDAVDNESLIQMKDQLTNQIKHLT